MCTVVGIQHRGAQCIIAEIGVDMSCFATARHLASWAGRCPGNDQSAGKRRSGKTRDGSKWLDFALEEAAMAAIRLKGHYLEAQYRRLKPRRGHKRALGAVKHTMLCAIWHMLSTGETYRDLGGDYYTNRDPERQTRRLVKQLERLGHHVTLQEPRQPERTFPVSQVRHRRRQPLRRPGRHGSGVSQVSLPERGTLERLASHVGVLVSGEPSWTPAGPHRVLPWASDRRPAPAGASTSCAPGPAAR